MGQCTEEAANLDEDYPGQPVVNHVYTGFMTSLEQAKYKAAQQPTRPSQLGTVHSPTSECRRDQNMACDASAML